MRACGAGRGTRAGVGGRLPEAQSAEDLLGRPAWRWSPGVPSLPAASRWHVPEGLLTLQAWSFSPRGVGASAGLPFQTGLLVTDSVKTLQKK